MTEGRVLEQEALSMRIAELLNASFYYAGTVKVADWNYIVSAIDCLNSIKTKNRIMRYTTKHLNGYIDYICFINFTNKFVIADQNCNSERTVIVYEDSLYDPILGKTFSFLSEYVSMLAAENTVLGIDAKRSHYSVKDFTRTGINRMQWNELINTNVNPASSEIIRLNKAWEKGE